MRVFVLTWKKKHELHTHFQKGILSTLSHIVHLQITPITYAPFQTQQHQSTLPA